MSHTAVITIHWEDNQRKMVSFSDKVDEEVVKAVIDKFAEKLAVDK